MLALATGRRRFATQIAIGLVIVVAAAWLGWALVLWLV